MEEQSAATREIASNVVRAADGTKEVSMNVADMSASAEQSEVSAQEVMASAEQLTEQSELLKREVAGFLERVRAA